MSEIKKIKQEELEQIQELQKKFNQYVFELGSVETQIQSLLQQKILLDKSKEDIVNDINTLAMKEKELITILQASYGTGNINPQTGEITSL